ncbi:Agamous-like MADS-box protein AGL75 [Abeliophyllum distichum]|uniref:Agamous-like MADS-box protein AGL75 n=1 Tax=Abeliophyllum distichum TaxID=126358 RepID=A0ABD1NRC5_9LAMI
MQIVVCQCWFTENATCKELKRKAVEARARLSVFKTILPRHNVLTKQNVRFVTEGAVKNQGTTNQELLTVIDAKLAQVRNRIWFLKSNDQGSIRDGSNEYTDGVTKEMSIFQEKISCDHTVVNSLWFDTKLDEIEGFEETEQLSSWLDSFLDKQPEIQDIQENPLWFDNLVGSGEHENQEILKTTPNAFNSGSELPETFALPYDQNRGGEFLETFVFSERSRIPAIYNDYEHVQLWQ